MTKTSKTINLIYYLIVVILILDELTSFDIKNQGIKSFIYYGLIIGTFIVILWNLFKLKNVISRLIFIAIPTFILFFVSNKFIFSTGTWHTQTILYKNKNFNFKKIEFQMQDIGSLGYNKRKVEVFYLTPLFMITNEISNNLDENSEWEKVNIDVNELGLKYP